MLKCVEGLYKDGKIELLESPGEVHEARVLVMFLPGGNVVDLQARGIDEAQAADLRGRLKTFAEDWERPEMDAYDAVGTRLKP